MTIIVFDAHCLLCNGWVQFLLRHDRHERYRFAAMQGATGRRLLTQAGLPTEGLETLLLVDGDESWQHTAAILKILHGLGWPWRLSAVARVVPAALRDPAYRWIARNRYRLFGRNERCLMPSQAFQHRFLD